MYWPQWLPYLARITRIGRTSRRYTSCALPSIWQYSSYLGIFLRIRTARLWFRKVNRESQHCHMAYIHYVLSHHERIWCRTGSGNSLKDKEGWYVNFWKFFIDESKRPWFSPPWSFPSATSQLLLLLSNNTTAPPSFQQNNIATRSSFRQNQRRSSCFLLRKATSRLPLLAHNTSIATCEIHSSSSTVQ